MSEKPDNAGLCFFRSRAAARCFQLGCLGFLGALGFIPGWERLFGLSGFFGFFGPACLLEVLRRSRSPGA